ncbi:MAG: porin [Gammaproteobacteria bacterium]|nr:OprO/OprP family phosphate-selective porin [Gammaproteobacteria bacterium]NNL99397.1 porin [Gammaproteobacteria bacterium]
MFARNAAHTARRRFVSHAGGTAQLPDTPARSTIPNRTGSLSVQTTISAIRRGAPALALLSLFAAVPAQAADQALLDILLGNGAITQAQYDSLMEKKSLSASDFSAAAAAPAEQDIDARVAAAVDARVDEAVAEAVKAEAPVKSDWGSKGFKLSTSDGRFATNLQWRAQMRYTYPFRSDPRQVGSFDDAERTFEARRVRMKIGGHAFQPWLGYYFEVDLQPTRSTDNDSARASSRLIDYRLTLDKYDWAALRVGQWKIDYNRERVDSSGRQQFVERSIVNRVFTIDRQMGVQLRGHLFKNTAADMRYYAGVFTGEGRGVSNDDDDLMYMGRLQWNFLGRDLAWKQTDVEYTDQPTGSLAFAAATNTGRCTRWSSSGCGNLDGFARPGDAVPGQFEVDQMVQEFAFKYRGLSIQEEFHWKTVEDNVLGTESDLTGAYAQAGYFFHNLIPAVPAPLELAFRYAFVDEPNRADRSRENNREEYTLAANWFFAGHRNKLTFDVSHLTLEDSVLNRDVNDQRVRLQWDISL